MKKATLVSVIYVYYNTPKELIGSVASLNASLKSKKFRYEVIVIDNASPVPIPKSIQKNSKIFCISNAENKGFGPALNQASSIAKGEVFIFLNPDTIVVNNAIEDLADYLMQNKNVGIVTPQLIDQEGNSLPSASKMPFLPKALVLYSFLRKTWPFLRIAEEHDLPYKRSSRDHSVPVVAGACMAVRASAFKKAGGFDSQFFMYFEEADLCFRVRKAGFDVILLSRVKVIHLIGRSSQDGQKIKRIFQESRFKFLRKYHGMFLALISEAILRYITAEYMGLFLLLGLSAFLNLYRINDLMMFFGDYGRDFLAARNMIITGKIALVGITSSVTWLHQGPLSIYLIALAFILGKFNPIAPAILYGSIGILTTGIIYFMVRDLWGKKAAFLSALLFCTSPIVIINARAPYHTAPIPFLASVLMLMLTRIMKGKSRSFFLLFFIFGLLLQLELANVVMGVVVIAILLVNRNKLSIKRKDILRSLLGLGIGIFPFILYDLTHHFLQTVGFLLWTMNRIRLFFGLTLTHKSTNAYFFSALRTILQQIIGVVFPFSWIIGFGLFCFSIIMALKKMKNKLASHNELLLVISWTLIPLAAFAVHAQPGNAYFPVVFPAISILLGWFWYQLISFRRIFILPLLLLIIINVHLTLTREYFLTTRHLPNNLFPNPSTGYYSYGYDYTVFRDTAKFIVSDAKNQPISLRPGGFIAKFATGVDNYKYLLWWMGANLKDTASIRYTIYQEKSEVPRDRNIVYTNGFIYVTKETI